MNTPAEPTRKKLRKLSDEQYWTDLFERAFWTGAEGLLATVSVTQFDLPVWTIVPIATGLAVLKGLVARKLGRTNSASAAYGI